MILNVETIEIVDSQPAHLQICNGYLTGDPTFYPDWDGRVSETMPISQQINDYPNALVILLKQDHDDKVVKAASEKQTKALADLVRQSCEKYGLDPKVILPQLQAQLGLAKPKEALAPLPIPQPDAGEDHAADQAHSLKLKDSAQLVVNPVQTQP